MKYKKLRKGSVARAIQDYLMDKENYQVMLKPGSGAWCWFAIPNNPDFCVALEWQGGYDTDDTKEFGEFGDGEYAVNASIKMTDDFRINGEYALYAETYYIEEGADLTGGYTMTESEYQVGFISMAKTLADDFNRFNRMKPVREL